MRLWDFAKVKKDEILQALSQHMTLVIVSVLIGAVIAVPLGIYLSRHKKVAIFVMAFTGIAQTIPGLVMLGISMIFLGIGRLPAIVVLSIYSVLPVLRNTYTGITEVDVGCKEAARGIGMNKRQMLYKIELPLAMPAIVGGLRLSTIYIISWATLAGLIGAGGLGDLIWTGLSTYSINYIYSGAIPAAVLALLAGALIGIIQKIITPKGMRKKGVL